MFMFYSLIINKYNKHFCYSCLFLFNQLIFYI